MTEYRGQKTEDGGQKTEDRKQRTEAFDFGLSVNHHTTRNAQPVTRNP